MEKQQWPQAHAKCQRLAGLFEFLGGEFAGRGLTDTAFDRLGAVAGGFLRTSLRSRGPYPSAQMRDVGTLRRYYAEQFPEMLAKEEPP